MSRSKTGWSEKVREIAEREYVVPARATRRDIRIPFGEFKMKLVNLGFPSSHANQVATPLESQKFWRSRGLELVSPKGQPRTVESVLEFRFISGKAVTEVQAEETPAAKAHRLTEKLRGLLKEEIAAYGGAEAFIRWVRSDDDEEAA